MIIEIRKQTLELLPEKALFWHDQKLLILADLHFGKTAAFQKSGLAVPEGSMQDDLNRISDLVDEYDPSGLLIAGDFIHAKAGLSELTITLISNILRELNVPIQLVLGNHDKALIKHMPSNWPIELYKEPMIIPPFSFCHDPKPTKEHYSIGGHIHPQIVLKSKVDRVKLPCFIFEKSYAILPAFSSFTGGCLMERHANKRIFVTTGQEVIEV